MKLSIKIILLLSLFFVKQNFAQTFTQVSPSMTNNPSDTWRPVITVLDGDNILDLLVGNANTGKFGYYKQSSVDGTTFCLITDLFNSITSTGYSSPMITDLDSDGLLDLIIGQADGTLLHYKQNSEFSTSFTQQTSLQTSSGGAIAVGGKSAPIFCDLDRDGLLDLLIGTDIGRIHHYEQSGVNSLTFDYITNYFNSIDYDGNNNHSVPAITDVDNNGKLDLFVGWFNGKISRYEQTSINSSTFSLVEQHFGSIDVGDGCSPAFSDFDNDGKLDLMMSKYTNGIEYWESDLVTINRSCVLTNDAASITVNSAVLGGEVTDDNSHLIIKRGICYSSSDATPDLTDSKYSMGKGTGTFSATISGLSEFTTYYYRSFCFSELRIFYGPVKSFRTTGYPPTLTTTDISSITNTSASSGGSITDGGSATVTARGVCYSTSPNPTISDPHSTDGSGDGSFTGSITGLQKNTRYYVRAYATNTYGTNYGEEKSFYTPNQLNNMVDFDGLANYISTSLSLQIQGTIEFWFKTGDYYSDYIWSLINHDANLDWYCKFSNGRIAVKIGTTNSPITSNIISEGQWYHVSIIWLKFGSSVTYQIYLNGNYQAT